MKNNFRPILSCCFGLIAVVLAFSSCATATTAATVTTAQKVDSQVQQALQNMVSSKFLQFSQANDLPPELGVFLHMETPVGNYNAHAGFNGDPVSEDTHYRIASVSKTFTAAAIMLLDQEGKLAIDDLITADIPGKDIPYLPDTDDFAIPNKESITIRNLLSHRAGVFDVFNDPIPAESPQPYAGMNYIGYMQAIQGKPDHQFTLEELVSIIAKDQLSYATPDVLYHYSDVGYMLLAGIVERVAGMSYDRFLQERFFGPLGLKNTSAPWNANDTTLPEPYFTGYTRWDDDFFSTVEDNMSCQIGPGNIIGTPKDIAHWIRALLSGRGPLTTDQVQRMKAIPEGNTTYALGISASTFGYGHSGAHPGYMNFTAYNEEHDISVVVVAPFIDYDAGDMTRLYNLLGMFGEISMEALKIAE
jgi:D-alanyl-D-alanine carboxypeptidase